MSKFIHTKGLSGLIAAAALAIASVGVSASAHAQTVTPTTTPTPAPTPCDLCGANTFTSMVGGGVSAGANGFFGSFDAHGVAVVDPNGHGSITLSDNKSVDMTNNLTYSGGLCGTVCGQSNLDASVNSTGQASAAANYTTTTPGVNAAIGNSATVANANVIAFRFTPATTTTTTTGTH